MDVTIVLEVINDILDIQWMQELHQLSPDTLHSTTQHNKRILTAINPSPSPPIAKGHRTFSSRPFRKTCGGMKVHFSQREISGMDLDSYWIK
jgi:hypothetical protein